MYSEYSHSRTFRKKISHYMSSIFRKPLKVVVYIFSKSLMLLVFIWFNAVQIKYD